MKSSIAQRKNSNKSLANRVDRLKMEYQGLKIKYRN
jgi:hypothetical protein